MSVRMDLDEGDQENEDRDSCNSVPAGGDINLAELEDGDASRIGASPIFGCHTPPADWHLPSVGHTLEEAGSGVVHAKIEKDHVVKSLVARDIFDSGKRKREIIQRFRRHSEQGSIALATC